VLSVDGTLCYYPGEDVKLAPLGTVFLDAVTKITMASDNSWPELPSFARPSALLALHTDARTYYLLADSPDTATSWLSKLQTELARIAPERAEFKDILGGTKVCVCVCVCVIISFRSSPLLAHQRTHTISRTHRHRRRHRHTHTHTH
jgi:hypothetical protein